MTIFTAPYVVQCLHSVPCCTYILTYFPVIDSLTAILVSRFLLELQEADHWAVIRIGTGASDSCNPSRQLYSDSSSSFISSLGAFINPDLPVAPVEETESQGR